jgi:hypothetical protein
MAFEKDINLCRLHFEAGAIDLVLDAAGEPNAASVIDQSAVSGPEPTLTEHRRTFEISRS